MTALMPGSLARSRSLVDPALRASLDRLDPTSRRVAAYHFGWVDTEGREVAEGNGGKALRPALALLSAQAAGAPPEVGLPGAIAVELVHNFSLLHDDLMDGDTQRRHRSTVWTVWGSATAILAGDGMLALAQQVLVDADGAGALRSARLLGAATQELIRGQVEDLAFEDRATVGVEECLRMAAGKTGALLGCAAAIGAELAEAPAATVRALTTYGEELGLAFQLVDDLLGIYGDEAVTGKPVGADLRARKKSLPISSAVTSGSVAGAELAAWLATPGPDSDAAVARAADLVEAAGGRSWAQAESQRRLDLAEAAIADLPIDDDIRHELLSLGRFVVARES